jgi:hypothetical protein
VTKHEEATRYLLIIAITLPLLVETAHAASHQPVEWRSHLTVNDARGNLLYVVTDIHQVDDAGGATAILVLDKATEQRFLMTRKYDIEGHRSLMQISDVSGKKYVRLWYALPSAAKTRDELASELEANPDLFHVADPIVTLETPGSSHTARISELSTEDTRERWLSDLRESLDPAFLEGLERMRSSFFGTSAGELFYSTLAMYMFHGGCSPATTGVKSVAEFPDCRFDKSFGFACSDRQLERITKAKGDKQTLDRY